MGHDHYGQNQEPWEDRVILAKHRNPAESNEFAEAVRSVQDGEKLDIYEFGKQLVKTQDLDPVYVVVWEAMRAGDLEPEYLKRWLLAYWCFYHVGTAAWITEGDTGYWQRMATAAGSKEYPRSSERRHFRGDNAKNSVAYLRDWGVQGIFQQLADSPDDAASVTATVQRWVGFGPWISFKVADMLERLNLKPVKFDTATVMYDSPQKAAELLWRVEHPGEGRRAQDHNEGEWAINRILGAVGRATLNPVPGSARLAKEDLEHVLEMQRRLARWAPPRYERPLGAQEAETILCKWKSYMEGHYHVGEDIAAVKSGLGRFARCPIDKKHCRLAQTLRKAGRRGGLWRI